MKSVSSAAMKLTLRRLELFYTKLNDVRTRISLALQMLSLPIIDMDLVCEESR